MQTSELNTQESLKLEIQDEPKDLRWGEIKKQKVRSRKQKAMQNITKNKNLLFEKRENQ